MKIVLRNKKKTYVEVTNDCVFVYSSKNKVILLFRFIWTKGNNQLIDHWNEIFGDKMTEKLLAQQQPITREKQTTELATTTTKIKPKNLRQCLFIPLKIDTKIVCALNECLPKN